MSEYVDACKLFFASPSGQQFLTTITGMIDSNHQKAEDNPELARDYMQRAKGIREVTNLISSIQAGTIAKA